MSQKGRLSEEQLVDKSLYEIGGKFEKSMLPGLEVLKAYTLELGKMHDQYKDSGSLKEFIKVKEKENKVVDELTTAQKLQVQIENNLIKTIERKKLASSSSSKALFREKALLNNMNKSLRDNARLNASSTSLIDKARIKRDQLARSLQSLIVKKELNNKLSKKEEASLRKLSKEHTKYRKAVEVAKKSTGQFQDNVGNYPSVVGNAIGVFKRFIPLVGAGFGLREAWNFANEIQETVREAKGVEFAFRNIGATGVIAFDRIKKSTRGLLSDLDIKKSIVEFDNFNLSAEALDTVLEFVAVRSTQTGKSFEYLRDSAIEAISKESVRRADNLGLSQKELNDKIKEGATFLEAFGEIAEREIREAGNILDEAADAQQRYNAAFENFKVSSGGGFFKQVTDGWYGIKTAVVETMTDVNDASDGFWDFLKNLGLASRGYGAFVKGQAIVRKEDEKRKTLINEIVSAGQKLGKTNAELEMIKKNLNQLEANSNGRNVFKFNSEDLTRELEQYNQQLEKTKEKQKALTIADLRKKIEKLTLSQEDLTLSDKKRANEIKNQIKLYQDQIDSLTKLDDKKKKQKDFAFEVAKFRIEQDIKEKNEIIKSEESSNKQILEAIIQREKLEAHLAEETKDKMLSVKNLSANERILIEEKYSAELIEIAKRTDKALDDLQTKMFSDADAADKAVFNLTSDTWEDDIEIQKQGIKAYAELLGFDGEKALEEYVKKHGYSFDAIKEFYNSLDDRATESAKRRKELERDVANSTADFVNSLFDTQIQKYDEQIFELERKYGLEYDLAEGNEKQQKLIRLREEQDKKKIEDKRRKELRKQAIFNKLFQAGMIYSSTAQAAAAALAPPPFGLGPLAGASLLPFIYANGALQVATVLAQPIPKYFKGTDNHPGGWAEVAEVRPEVIKEPGKDPYIIHDRSIVDLPKGTQVIPSVEEYQKLFAGSQIASLEMNARKATTYTEKESFDKTQLNKLIEQNERIIDATKKSKTNVSVTQAKPIDFDYEEFRRRNITWS